MLLCGKAMIENPCQVFAHDPYPIVDNGDSDPIRSGHTYPHDQAFSRWVLFVHRVFGIAQNINKDLQDLMPVHANGRNVLGKLTHNSNPMPLEGCHIHPQRILHQRHDR